MLYSVYFYIILKVLIFINQFNSTRTFILIELPSQRALSWLNWLSLGIQFNSILKPGWWSTKPVLMTVNGTQFEFIGLIQQTPVTIKNMSISTTFIVVEEGS